MSLQYLKALNYTNFVIRAVLRIRQYQTYMFYGA
jgi:hypothetical protein